MLMASWSIIKGNTVHSCSGRSNRSEHSGSTPKLHQMEPSNLVNSRCSTFVGFFVRDNTYSRQYLRNVQRVGIPYDEIAKVVKLREQTGHSERLVNNREEVFFSASHLPTQSLKMSRDIFVTCPVRSHMRYIVEAEMTRDACYNSHRRECSASAWQAILLVLTCALVGSRNAGSEIPHAFPLLLRPHSVCTAVSAIRS